jgi:general secretion pathway protein C
MDLSPHSVRRAWPLVVVVLVASAAYFQAAGLSMLAGTALAPSAMVMPRGAPADTAAETASEESASGQPILLRNPFDSQTGPLGVESRREGEVAPPKVTDPLAAPKCEDLRVDSTTESSDPMWSMAVLQGKGEKHGRLRRVGQLVSGKTVAYIGYNRREKSPAVWLMSEGTLCQALLFDEAKRPKVQPKPKRAAPKRPVRKNRRGPPSLPKNIGSKIRKVSANEYQVDRSAVDVIVRDATKLMRGVAVRPMTEGGRVTGLRVARVTPTSLLGSLGLRNGDVLKSINGFPIVSPDKALAAYARLRTANQIRIELLRGGKPTTVEISIH